MAYDENIKKLLIALYVGGKSPEEIAKFLSNLRTKTDYEKIKDISTSLGLPFNQLDWAVLVNMELARKRFAAGSPAVISVSPKLRTPPG